jgi:hypothetical protein
MAVLPGSHYQHVLLIAVHAAAAAAAAAFLCLQNLARQHPAALSRATGCKMGWAGYGILEWPASDDVCGVHLGRSSPLREVSCVFQLQFHDPTDCPRLFRACGDRLEFFCLQVVYV